MAFIEPLEMGTWLPSVFAGTPDVFLAIAILVIFGMAGYFKMDMLATFFMIVTFLLILSSFINSPIIMLIAVIGGLLIGYSISKIFS